MRPLTEREREITQDYSLTLEQKIIKLRQLSMHFWTYDALGEFFEISYSKVFDIITRAQQHKL